MSTEQHPGQFGPAVIGEDAFEAEQQEVEEERRLTFGEAVISGSNMGTEPPATDAEPEEEEDDIPEGYEIEFSGAYGTVYAPDGTQVTADADTESGKYHGREAAVEAAWAHAEREEAEEEPEAAPEDEEESGGEEEPEGEHGFPEEGVTPEDVKDATIEEVHAALEENPALVDQFMHAEIVREDGVRAEVLDAMEEAELGKEEPRDEVLESLESLRAELQTPDEE